MFIYGKGSAPEKIGRVTKVLRCQLNKILGVKVRCPSEKSFLRLGKTRRSSRFPAKKIVAKLSPKCLSCVWPKNQQVICIGRKLINKRLQRLYFEKITHLLQSVTDRMGKLSSFFSSSTFFFSALFTIGRETTHLQAKVWVYIPAWPGYTQSVSQSAAFTHSRANTNMLDITKAILSCLASQLHVCLSSACWLVNK